MATLEEKYPSLKKAYEGPESHDGREIALLNYVYAHPSLPQLRDSPQKLLDLIDKFAAQEDFLINIGPHKGAIVTSIIAKEKPVVLVELGGYIGYSAILFASEMRKYASEKPIRIWSIETDPLSASIAMNFIALAGLSDIVTVVVGKADESLKRLHAEGKLQILDMLFLDHVEALYVQDFQVCETLGLLKKGSVVVADNVVRPGAPEYRKLVRAYPGLQSEGVKGLIMPGEFEDELEISKVK